MMRKLIAPLLLAMALFAGACSGEKGEKMELQTISVEVDGMTCGGCETMISDALKKVDGVVEASASHTEKTATVKVKAGSVTEAKVIETITKAGYESKAIGS